MEVYCDLAGIKADSLKKVATPGMDDHQLKPEDFETEGSLSKDAAKIIMKALYGARLVRFELLWPICSSARNVSKWTRACDKRLHRLMCYIHHTPEHSLESYVGDNAEDCHPVLFSDADFAGDIIQAKSTSGLYLAIVGPNTFAPVTASCKKQTCVSHSSTESEIVAAEQGIRCEGLQVLAFWELVTELLGSKADQKAEMQKQEKIAKPGALEINPYSERFDPGKYFAYTRKTKTSTVLVVAEDNEAVIKNVKKARSMSLRHLPRTHRIDVNWFFESMLQPTSTHALCQYQTTVCRSHDQVDQLPSNLGASARHYADSRWHHKPCRHCGVLCASCRATRPSTAYPLGVLLFLWFQHHWRTGGILPVQMELSEPEISENLCSTLRLVWKIYNSVSRLGSHNYTELPPWLIRCSTLTRLDRWIRRSQGACASFRRKL